MNSKIVLYLVNDVKNAYKGSTELTAEINNGKQNTHKETETALVENDIALFWIMTIFVMFSLEPCNTVMCGLLIWSP